MANNEELNQANQGAPAADIPDLKKKEKERKKSGAAWSGAKPGASPFSGATGGAARAAASAASGAGAAGAAGAAGGFSLSSFLASLTATLLGKLLVAAGVAAFLMGAGLVGYALLKGGATGGATGDLGALASNMKIRSAGGDRTGVTGTGDLMFDQAANKPAETKKEETKPAEETKGDAVPKGAADGAGQNPNWKGGGLEHNLSGAKLSSSMGSSFGGKNIFSGNGPAPKFDAGAAKSTLASQKGTMSANKSAKTGRMVSGGTAARQRSSKAFGQLKIAKGMSMLGAGSNVAEGAHSGAAAAFDGSNGTGNVEGGPGGINGGAVTSPSGGGAPDTTAPNVSDPCAGGKCSAVDGNQAAMIAGIAAMAKQAGEMKKKAEEMMILGIALIAVGIALIAAGCTIWTAWCIPIGVALVAMGGALIGASMMMSQMADMMQQMAQSMSQSLAQRTGDENQNRINKYCIDKAYNDGVDPKDCNPPDSVTNGSRYDAARRDGLKQQSDTNGVNGKTETVAPRSGTKPKGN